MSTLTTRRTPFPLVASTLLFIIAVAIPLMLIHLLHYKLPFGDEWNDNLFTYFSQLHHNPHIVGLFYAHNEHRILLTRLLYKLNYWLFPQSSSFMNLASYALFAGWLCLIIQRLSSTLKALYPDQAKASLWFYCLLALITFPAMSFPFWQWQFIVQFPLTLFFVTASLFVLQANTSWPRLLIAMGLCWLTTYSSANGLAIWPLSFLLLLFYRHHWIKVVAFSLVAIATIYHYTINDQTQSLILNQPLASLNYFVGFLGRLLTNVNHHALIVTYGTIACVLYAYLLMSTLRSKDDVLKQQSYVWLALGLFTIANAGIASVTRLPYGISARYASLAAPLYITIAVLIRLRWPSIRRRSKAVCLILIAAFIVSVMAGFSKLYSLLQYQFHYGPQEVALPYNVILPNDNSVFPPGNGFAQGDVNVGQLIIDYKHSSLYSMKKPTPNYLHKTVTLEKQHQMGMTLEAKTLALQLDKPSDKQYSQAQTGSALKTQITLPQQTQPLSNALLVFDNKQQVIGIAFAAAHNLAILPVHTTLRVYGFVASHRPVDHLLWLYAPYKIQQDLSLRPF